MADRQLHVNITTTETVSSSIKAMNKEIDALVGVITVLQRVGVNASEITRASIQKQIDTYHQQIAVVQQQIATYQREMEAIRLTTAALQERARAEAQVLLIEAERGKLEASLGPTLSREILSASASASTFANSLSVAAAADSALRDAAIGTSAALARQQELMGMAARRYALTGVREAPAVSITTVGAQEAIDNLAQLKLAFIDTQGTMETFEEAARQETIATQTTLLSAETAWESALGKRNFAMTENINKTVELMKAEDTWARSMKEAKFASEELTASDEKAVALKTEDIAKTLELMQAEDAWASRIKQVTFANDEWTQSQLMAESAMARGMGGRTFADDTEAIASGMGRVTKEGNALSGSMRHIVGFFDAIARGQFGQAMSSIASGVRDLGASTLALGSSLGVLVTVFATMAVFRKAEEMAKWAEETKAAAAASGMAVQDFSRLQGAMSLVGVKADEADASLRALAQSTSIAIENSSSKQAEAFHNLGISQEKLIATGGDVSKVMNLLADAYVRTADGANKAANFSEILHRNWEKLIPALQGGSTELQNLKDRAEELGITLTDEMIAKLEQSGQAVKNLGDKIRGDGIKAMVAWSQTITDAANGLTILLNLMGKVANVISKPIDWLHDATRDATAYAYALMHGITYEQALIELHKVGLKIGSDSPTAADLGEEAAQKQAAAVARGQRGLGQVPVPALTGVTSVEQMHAQISAAELAADKGAKTIQEQTERRLQAAIGILKQTLASGQLDPKDVLTVQDELNSKMMELDREKLSSSTRTASAAARESYKEFAEGEKAKILDAGEDAQKIGAIYDEWAHDAVAVYHQAASLEMQIENEKTRKLIELAKKAAEEQLKAKLESIKEGAREEEGLVRLVTLNSQLADIAARRYQFKGQEKDTSEADVQRSQRYVAEAEQVRAMADVEISSLQQIEAAAEKGSQVQKDAQAEILSVLTQSVQKQVELYKQAGDAAVAAANKDAEAWTKAFDEIGSEFEKFGGDIVKSILEPQTTITRIGLTSIKTQENSVRAAFKSLFLGIAQDLGKTLEQSLGHAIARALSGGASNTIGDMLGKLFSKVFSSTAADAASKVASSAATSATSDTAIVTAITGSTTGISTAIGTAGTAQTTAVTTGSASIVAAITTNLAITNGLLTALNAKPSVMGTTYAGGGIVSAAGGMVSAGGQIAFLHAREMVLPRHLSEGIQHMITGGMFGRGENTANLNYSPNIQMARGRGGTGMTRSEFSTMLSMHSGAMMGEARNMMRSGWRP